MDKPQEILEAISRFRRDTNFTMLRKRWQTDFDLYRLKPYDAGSGYYSYTSNASRIVADKGIAMLTSAKLLIRIPDALLSDEEREVASDVERYVYGAINYNDEDTLYTPNRRTIRQLKAWYAVVRGGFAERVYVYKNEEGKTCPEIAVWDLYNVSYGTDSKGISWAAHTYKIPTTQASEEYGTKIGGSEVECVDFWDREKNLFIVGGKEQYRIEHKLGYCPVFIFRVGATPTVWQDNYQYTDVVVGESIFASLRHLSPILNKTLSDLLTIVRRGVKVPMGYWSATGKKTIDQDIFQVEKAAVVPFQHGEVFTPLITQSMPANAQDLVNIVFGEWQRGSWPNTTYGEVSTRLSGYAINQLNAAMTTVISPFIETLEHSYLVDALELIKQYAESDLPAVEVRGRNSRNQAFGYPKAYKITPKRIKGYWHPEIELVPELPRDEPMRFELARMARMAGEGETPMLSDQTIRGELLGVQDPQLEDALIDREWADKQIVSRLYDAYIEASRPGNDPMKAVNILAALRMAMSSTPPSRPPQQPSRGLSARTLPPESMGMTPPGAQNALEPPPTGEA